MLPFRYTFRNVAVRRSSALLTLLGIAFTVVFVLAVVLVVQTVLSSAT